MKKRKNLFERSIKCIFLSILCALLYTSPVAAQTKSEADVKIEASFAVVYSIVDHGTYLEVKAAPSIRCLDLKYKLFSSPDYVWYEKDNDTFNNFLFEHSNEIEKIEVFVKQN